MCIRDRRQADQFPDSQFFSVRAQQRELQALVRQCVRANGGRCILHGKVHPVHAQSASAQAFRLQDLHVREAAPVDLLADQVNVMFHAG